MTLFVLLSFDGATSDWDRFRAGDPRGAALHPDWAAHRGAIIRAGAMLGPAAATHLSTLLFLPFWLVIASRAQTRRACAAAGGCFLVGAFAVLALLAFYNYARFGSILETGRTFRTAEFGYGAFQVPWRGAWGLVGSPGKGLLLFCPVVLLGLAGWRRFAARSRSARFLAFMLGAALLGRYLFIAARSDWHGGFCLGPRHHCRRFRSCSCREWRYWTIWWTLLAGDRWLQPWYSYGPAPCSNCISHSVRSFRTFTSRN